MTTYNFESQKKSARNLVLSPNKQSTIGEVMADTALTRTQRFDGSAVLELKQTRRSDKEMAGKGTEFATDGQVTAWDTSFSFKAELDDWLAAWAFAFAMGKDTVTGSAAPYSHAIAFDETTTQAPVTCVYLEDTSALKYKAQDMAVSDITLTIPARGACTLETSMIGSGRWTDGAMVSGPPALTAYQYLLGSDCSLMLGAHGATTTLVGRHMSTTLKVSTGVVNHTAPGGGLFGIFLRTGLRKVSFQTTIAATNTEDIRTLLENDTEREITWNIASGASSLNLDIPYVHLKTAKLGVSGNMVVWQIEGDETTIFNKTGSGVLAATVVNSAASFLAAA